MHTALPESNWRELLLWRLGRRRLLRVTGDSMTPTLPPGAVVLLDPAAYRRRHPRVGEIVVARHPYRQGLSLLKRIAAVTDDGRYILHSDNPAEGTDSRAFGPVSEGRILGRVTSRLG